MGIAPNLTPLLDQLRDVVVPDDMARDEALETARVVLVLRNLIDHLAATVTGVLDRLGVAAAQGRTLRELLISLGCAPVLAERLVRVGGALPLLPTLAAHAGDGAISSEHVDAIVKGINHIQARSPGEVDEAARFAQVTDLLGQFFSGATPAQIGDRARRLGNRVAAAEGGLPAAEDRSIIRRRGPNPTAAPTPAQRPGAAPTPSKPCWTSPPAARTSPPLHVPSCW
jgi:hypothetical protein